jgi:hypothetical protein
MQIKQQRTRALARCNIMDCGGLQLGCRCYRTIILTSPRHRQGQEKNIHQSMAYETQSSITICI